VRFGLRSRAGVRSRGARRQHLVLGPLFSLSFFCAEFLQQEHFFGARQAISSSASSKTALGRAYLLTRAQSSDVEIVGLTYAAFDAF
jgi:hypothetical protein